ncbi:bifunctional DNA primase/polymerase [Saccharothrix yanglingensis]|uniref:DNA primase n=1 Tax=Saccharothrix yanglingensis TaxID=659496 RepID=A0ABU0WS17_9PSEU|nr:bifunctional DNA primase/polymerase [Saccharothrix yanglingensis]MDQ2582606.1 DNA primase [Saccharothrix yanglingensis]
MSYLPSAASMLRHALDAAASGFHVFPLRPGTKVPALHGERRCPRTGPCTNGHLGWEQRATTDPAVVERCWATGPFNVGIATGPSGLLVVDLDMPKSLASVPDEDGCSRGGVTTGRDVLTDLCAAGGHPVAEVFDTRSVITAKGGDHLYYRAPVGVELRNTASALGPMVDTRAHGGYVVGPGSQTPDGPYSVGDDRAPADPPTWLVQALTPTPRTARTAPIVSRTERLPGYVAAAVRGERDRVAAAQPGRHTHTLFVASVALGQLVGGGLLPAATAEAELHTAALHMITDRCGCTENEVLRTIGNGLRAGATRPRKAPETTSAQRGAA